VGATSFRRTGVTTSVLSREPGADLRPLLLRDGWPIDKSEGVVKRRSILGDAWASRHRQRGWGPGLWGLHAESLTRWSLSFHQPSIRP